MKDKKNVTFGENETVDQGIEGEKEEEVDPYIEAHRQKEHARISPEEREALHRTLANEFVKSKMAKQRTCVRLYLWLQNTFV